MSTKQFGALLGFLFVATWVVLNFGYAILCLVGAGVFYLAASYMEGDVDVAEIQSRLSPRGGIGAPAGPPRTGGTAAPQPAARPAGAPPRVR